jgi:hypothetical protein
MMGGAFVWLANVILGLVTSAASFFGLQLSKKVLFAATAIASFLSLTATFVAVVHGLLAGISHTMPSAMANAFALFMPDNLSACISAVFAAKVARWIYDYHVETLKIASYIT